MTSLPAKDHDPVNHPSHYTSDPSGVECIQITRHRNFNIGNAIKYLWRCGLKDQATKVEDLEKAVWYIQDEIKRIKEKFNKYTNTPKSPISMSLYGPCWYCGETVNGDAIAHNNNYYHNACFKNVSPEWWAKYNGVKS
jgi:hypothetical protein